MGPACMSCPLLPCPEMHAAPPPPPAESATHSKPIRENSKSIPGCDIFMRPWLGFLKKVSIMETKKNKGRGLVLD